MNFKSYTLGRGNHSAEHETLATAISTARACYARDGGTYAVRWIRKPGAIFSINVAGELHGRDPGDVVPHGTPFDIEPENF